jgi:hypothetical protein
MKILTEIGEKCNKEKCDIYIFEKLLNRDDLNIIGKIVIFID